MWNDKIVSRIFFLYFVIVYGAIPTGESVVIFFLLSFENQAHAKWQA